MSVTRADADPGRASGAPGVPRFAHDIPHPIGDPDEDDELPGDDEDDDEEDEDDDEEPLQVRGRGGSRVARKPFPHCSTIFVF